MRHQAVLLTQHLTKYMYTGARGLLPLAPYHR
jgi:hypothetical protein